MGLGPVLLEPAAVRGMIPPHEEHRQQEHCHEEHRQEEPQQAMTHDAERCQRCHQLIRAGATFCPACGVPLNNRAARSVRNTDHARQARLDGVPAHGTEIPGNIPVVPAQAGPDSGQMLRGRRSESHALGGETGMAVQLEVVPASAGKRLGAAVLDWLPPFTVLVVMFAFGFASVTRTQSGGFIIYDTSMLVLLGGMATAVALVYAIVVMGIEGRTGNTPGNRLMGIRSADKDGYAPGSGAVLVRGLITGAGILLAIVAAVVVVALKWFDVALWILVPLFLLGTAWALLVVPSNAWDRNGRLRAWNDAAAKTLVFDIKAGRNPITSGGIQGPYSFAPLDLPPVQPVPSPVAGAAPAIVPQTAPPNPAHWKSPAASQPAAVPPPADAAQLSATPQPSAFAPTEHRTPAEQPAAPGAVQDRTYPLDAGHPDDEHDRTRMRGTSVPAPTAPAAPVLRLRLDDGRDFQLDRTVLVGRNPAAHPGEQVEQLLAVADPGRSISKTHLHLLVDEGGIWVTDRNSTNGSSVTTPDGVRTPLQAGQPAYVAPGSIVSFGDRTFHLGQA